MDQNANAELENISQELKQINRRLDGNDQRFEKIDQRFEKIDQRFEKIDQRLDSDFGVVHTSINKLAIGFYKKCLEDDHKHSDLKAMFDTFMHRTNSMERLPVLEKKVDDHGRRISKLEATRKG